MSEPVTISPSTDMTIFEVSELKQNLLDALAAGSAVTLDLTHAGNIDASGLQTMMAAHRSGKLILQGLSVATIETFRRLGWDPTDKGIL